MKTHKNTTDSKKASLKIKTGCGARFSTNPVPYHMRRIVKMAGFLLILNGVINYLACGDLLHSEVAAAARESIVAFGRRRAWEIFDATSR